jgi:hypothetical protein
MRASRSLDTPIVFVVSRWLSKLTAVAPPSRPREKQGGVAGRKQENTISCAEMRVLSLSCVNYVD